jgi:restriction endonuclease S subunit
MKSGLVSIKKLQTNAWLNLLAETPEESYLNNPLYQELENFCGFNRHKFSVAEDKDYRYIDLSSIDRNLGVVKRPEIYKGINLPDRARRWVRYGDILVTLIWSEDDGIVFTSDTFDKCVASNAFAVLTAKEISPEYLYFCMRLPSTTEQIKKKIKGSAMPRISIKDIRTIKIPILEPTLQQEITEKVSQYLNSAAPLQPLDWVLFPHFGSMRRGGGINRNPTTFIPFTNIQNRWDVQYLKIIYETEGDIKLGSIIKDIRVGYTPPVFKNNREILPTDKNVFPFLGPRQVEAGRIANKQEQYIQLEEKALGTHVLQQGDIVMVRIGTDLGRSAIITVQDIPCVANQHLVVIRCDPELVNPNYLMWLFNSSVSRNKLQKLAGGTYQSSITLRDLTKLSFDLPGLDEQALIVKEIEESINNEKVNKMLQELRELGQSIMDKVNQ